MHAAIGIIFERAIHFVINTISFHFRSATIVSVYGKGAIEFIYFGIDVHL